MKITEDKLKEMIRLYTEDKVSTTFIANKLKMSPTTVTKYLRNANIKIHKAKYKFNDEYFKKINTSTKAYFLGLIYADGSLNNTGGSCVIKLVYTDGYILEKLKEELDLQKPLGTSKEEIIKGTKYIGKERKILNITSKNLILDLNNLGIFPNKSQTILFPKDDIVPNHLKWDFIRGYMDGDGCIRIASDNTIRVSIAGNKLFLEEMSNFIYKNLQYKPKITKHTSANCYYYKINRLNKVIDFCSKIYEDKNCVKLTRKYYTYTNYLNSEHYSKVKNYLKNNGTTYGINKYTKI